MSELKSTSLGIFLFVLLLFSFQILVKSEKEIQVQRKLTQIDSEIRTLIEVFNMDEYNKLPDVEM
jgi:cell division protein FtsL